MENTNKKVLAGMFCLVAVLFVFITIAGEKVKISQAAAITMGETNVLSINDGGNAGLLLAQQTTLSQTATIQSLSFYASAASGKLRLGVYDATGQGGGPGAKKAETAEMTPIVGWNTANVISPVSLPAGTYWLAYAPSSSNLSYRRSGTGSFKMYSFAYGTLPATFSTSPSSGADHWSFYATLNTGTTTPDTTPPTVSLTAPANGSTVSGTTVTVSANAADDVAVAGVQFLLDGVNLGAEDTSAPYSIVWNTTTATNATHTLSAVARDSSGNTTVSGWLNVTVNNVVVQLPTGTVVIDNGINATNVLSSTLTLSASSTSGTITQMRFSNTGSSYSTAETYSTTKTWSLSSGAGTKTVYAQFKDSNNNWSNPVTDTIIYDATAPTITNIAASNISGNGATIGWTTNEPATSQVDYGPTTSYGQTTTIDPSLVTTHSVVLSGLNPLTTYNYRVRSQDEATNEKLGANKTFKTLSGPSDTIAPSIPTNLNAGAVSSSRIDLTWTASTDNIAVTGYKIFRDGSQIGTSATNSYSSTNLQPNTLYTYTVSAYDAAGNNSAQSTSAQDTTLADTVAPTVSVTSPVNGATIFGNWALSANASDDVGVAGVTFFVDGSGVGSEDTTAPYNTTLNTTTLIDGTHIITAVARDTSGNFTSSSDVSVTVNNTNPPTGIPTLVQHISTATNSDPAMLGNPYYINLPNATGAGNALVAGITYPYASGRTVNVSDDAGNTWALAAVTPANPTAGQQVSAIYYALNIAAGTRKVTVTFDHTLYHFQGVVSEFYNVASAGALDGITTNSNSTAPNVNPGTLTTSSDGDLIYSYGIDATGGDNVTHFTAGNGLAFLSADNSTGAFAEYQAQNSAGSLIPGVTITGAGDRYNALAIGLRSAHAGTPPGPGMHIVHEYHVFDTRRTVPLQFPTSGNLLVIATAFTPGQTNISAVTSNPTSTWSKPNFTNSSASPQVWYAPMANSSTDLIITPTLGNTEVTLILYDVSGAADVPLDTVAGIPRIETTNTNNADLLNYPLFNPSAAGELVFSFMNNGDGPTTGMVTPGYVLDTVTYGGEIDRDTMDNADGYAHFFNPSSAQVSFGWHMNSSRIPESSAAIAIGFKPAP